MTRRPTRATGFALLRATALACALLSPSLAWAQPAPPGRAAPPASDLSGTSLYVPGQGIELPDADRRAAIEGQRRTIEDHREAAREAADAGGMPQLDFGNPLTISQVVWLFVIFGLFVFLCSHYLLPPVAGVLADRRARIGGDLDAARTAKTEADAAAAAHREGTARARAEAQAAIAGAVQAANADAASKAAALNEQLNAQIAAAESRINAARDAAMGALREVSVDAAGALVERLSGIRDPAAVSAAVDRALAARAPAARGAA